MTKKRYKKLHALGLTPAEIIYVKYALEYFNQEKIYTDFIGVGFTALNKIKAFIKNDQLFTLALADNKDKIETKLKQEEDNFWGD